MDPSVSWDLFDDFLNFSSDDYDSFDPLGACNFNSELDLALFPEHHTPIDSNAGLSYNIGSIPPDDISRSSSTGHIPGVDLSIVARLSSISPPQTELGESGRRQSEAERLQVPAATPQLVVNDLPADEKIFNSKKAKSKWKGSMIVFSTKNGNIINKRRSAFCEKRKREVAMNRVIGACIQCKLRKGSCNFGLPCDHCIKRTGSAALGQQICMRQNLLATRFDSVDLFKLAIVEQRVQDYGVSMAAGSRGHAHICYPGTTGRNIPDAYITVPIVEFNCTHFSGVMNHATYNYYGRKISTLRDSTYAIAPDSLPNSEALVHAYSAAQGRPSASSGPFRGICNAVREFAEEYCRISETLPMQPILEKSLRLQLLFYMYKTGIHMNFSKENPTMDYASSAMTLQLRVIISKAIVELETEVFSSIDRLIGRSGELGKQNPIATWTCLWTLILSYKEHMIFIRYFHDNVGEQIYRLTRHIYNTLTSIYTSLYKTTSPLTLDWRTEEVAEMLGKNPALIRLFCDIKTEMFWFYSQRDKLLPEDALFKFLVVENESKLVSANLKAAKKKGIL